MRYMSYCENWDGKKMEEHLTILVASRGGFVLLIMQLHPLQQGHSCTGHNSSILFSIQWYFQLCKHSLRSNIGNCSWFYLCRYASPVVCLKQWRDGVLLPKMWQQVCNCSAITLFSSSGLDSLKVLWSQKTCIENVWYPPSQKITNTEHPLQTIHTYLVLWNPVLCIWQYVSWMYMGYNSHTNLYMNLFLYL